MKARDYTEGELWIAIRQERLTLVQERVRVVERLTEIEDRLEELNRAEDILEGGL